MKEIVAVERADQAGAGLAVQAPLIQIIGVAVLSFPTHLDKRKSVLKHSVSGGKGTMSLFTGKANVEFMGADILWAKPLIGPVAQKFISDKLLDHQNLVVHGAGAAGDPSCFSLLV